VLITNQPLPAANSSTAPGHTSAELAGHAVVGPSLPSVRTHRDL
jgi:hypothetical protein